MSDKKKYVVHLGEPAKPGVESCCTYRVIVLAGESADHVRRLGESLCKNDGEFGTFSDDRWIEWVVKSVTLADEYNFEEHHY